MILKPIFTSILAAALAACAASTPVTDTGTPDPSVRTSASASGESVRWSGSLQPAQQRTGGLGPTGQNKTFGNVMLVSRGPERMAVEISLSTPLQGSTSLSWALVPGQCGSAAMPLVGIERFPVIEVGNNGRGQLNAEMSLALPASGTFHVNIYWPGGQQLSDVMTCGNLRKR